MGFARVDPRAIPLGMRRVVEFDSGDDARVGIDNDEVDGKAADVIDERGSALATLEFQDSQQLNLCEYPVLRQTAGEASK